MTGTVTILSMAFMALSFAISFALPIGLLLYFRIKKHAALLPFFVGCGVMLVFALILESAVHRLVLGSDVGERITGNLWIYALYGGFMAGLFEETGRFLAFKTVLRGCREKDVNALMYGAGHGGFEAVALVGIAMINNLIYSVLINTGNTEILTGSLSGDLLAQVETVIQTLIDTPSWQFLLGGVERIFAMILQIALSVLVWFGANRKGKWHLYPAAILIHLLVDGITVLLSGSGVSLILVEAAVAAFAALVTLLAAWTWKACRAAE